MQKIFVVEDDTSIRELVTYALRGNNYEVIGFEEGSEVVGKAQEIQPNLILLDIMLPGEGGLEILTKLKKSQRTQQIPVIMITAKVEEYVRVSGLDMGADDYITKPFSILELLARVRAVLRRVTPVERDQLVVGGITVDVQRRKVTTQGNPVVLTYKEFELLSYMMEYPDIVLDRERILSRVWGFDFLGETRTVDMHIKTLRHKLGPLGGMIQTVRGVGYTLTTSFLSEYPKREGEAGV